MIEQYSSLSEKFLRKGFWLYIFSFIIAPIGYLIKIIVSHELSVNEVGILYGIISLITLLSGFNDFGTTESIKKFVPQFIEEKNYGKIKFLLISSIGVQLITSLIIFFIFFFAANYISEHFLHTDEATNVLKIFSVFFIGLNLFQVGTSFFMAVQDTFLAKFSELIRMFTILVITLGIFFTDTANLILFSYAWVFGLYIGVIFSYVFFHKKYYHKYLKGVSIVGDIKLLKSIFSYALTIFLGTQAATILSQIDMQMILFFLGTQDAGYYTNYLSVISIPFLVITPIFGILFPIFSELKAKEKIDDINTIKKVFQQNFIFIAIAISIFFFVFSDQILLTLFGEKFIPSGEILKFSTLFLVFSFLLQINFHIMTGVGYIKERVYIIVIAIIFNIITNLIFIHIFGVAGAALATGLGWLLIWLLTEYTLRKDFSFNLNYVKIFKNTTIFIIIGIFSNMLLLGFFHNVSRMQALVGLIIVTLFYVLCFGLINKNELLFLKGEIKKLKK